MPETVSKQDETKDKEIDNRLDAVVNLAKRRGFVYPCGLIYGGTRSAWDYGPLGFELKENIKKCWLNSVVRTRLDVVSLDSSVILPRRVWEASGHVSAFTDPLIECQNCHKRQREDTLLEHYCIKHQVEEGDVTIAQVSCPECGKVGEWTEPKEFSGLLKTYLGPVDDEEGLHYLRPETAQGIFVNFDQVRTTARMKVPFGIAQIGKAFRNEITPGNFIFRTREFEQMELEFFCKPGTDEDWHQYWIDQRLAWYKELGIKPENLRLYEHPKEKLSHYSKRTVDIEYAFGFLNNRWGELEGIANRTDYDLGVHSLHSNETLDYYEESTKERFIPYVIEPSAGLTRSFMAFLVDAYSVDMAPNTKGGVDERVVLRLDPRLAPIKAAVLPLSKKPNLIDKSRQIFFDLSKRWNIAYDEAGAIGRRYRRQDEVGTCYCITVDFASLEDNCVTIRERDSMKQERISIDNIEKYLYERLEN